MRRPTSKPGESAGEVIGASEFKRRCLELLEATRHRGKEYVITKRGEPVARVVPIRGAPASLRGLMKDRLLVRGDIIRVDWTEDWEAAR